MRLTRGVTKLGSAGNGQWIGEMSGLVKQSSEQKTCASSTLQRCGVSEGETLEANDVCNDSLLPIKIVDADLIPRSDGSSHIDSAVRNGTKAHATLL